ncbi:unnamed protein product [Heligmosomoides polygyrus]|uniref:RNA-directed RNA polymerase n=1 Tax=Heligmosomoides polygyrus TaxID=6339 RepID=A0A183G286_HELPZ|nr:unnamed protein product [Heligmosomoides polygyrus]
MRFMNIALEQTEEYNNGQLQNKYVLANVRSQQFIREDGDAKPHIYVTAIVEVLRDYRGYPISRRAHPLSSHCLLVPALMHISPDHIPATLPVSADVLADLSGQFSASGDPAPMGCAFDTTCIFPVGMPSEVFFLKRTAAEKERGIIPKPDVLRLPKKYRTLPKAQHANLWTNSEEQNAALLLASLIYTTMTEFRASVDYLFNLDVDPIKRKLNELHLVYVAVRDQNVVEEGNVHWLLFLKKAGGVYGINSATAAYEAKLVPGKLNDITNSYMDNSRNRIHAVRKEANRMLTGTKDLSRRRLGNEDTAAASAETPGGEDDPSGATEWYEGEDGPSSSIAVPHETAESQLAVEERCGNMLRVLLLGDMRTDDEKCWNPHCSLGYTPQRSPLNPHYPYTRQKIAFVQLHTFATSAFVPNTSANVSRSSVTVQNTSANLPKSSVTVPKTSANLPGSSVAVPNTSANVPKSSVTVPNTSSNLPKSSVAMPNTSANLLEEDPFLVQIWNPAADSHWATKTCSNDNGSDGVSVVRSNSYPERLRKGEWHADRGVGALVDKQ